MNTIAIVRPTFRRCIVAAIVALSLASAAHAAFQFTEVTTNSGRQKSSSKMAVIIDGSRMRGEFVENSEPMPPAGTYIIVLSKDETYMVVPSKKNYARFDREQMNSMTQAGMQNAQQANQQMEAGGMTTTIEDKKETKVVDEAGPDMFGLHTRHYKFTLTYKEVRRMKGMPMAITTNFDNVYEFWATMDLMKELGDSWASQGSVMSGIATADVEMAADAEMQKLGFKLKSITTSKTSGGGMGFPMMGGGRKSQNVRTTEVVAFERATPSDDSFALPKDYQETDMMNLFTGGAMPDLNAQPGSSDMRQQNQTKRPRSSMPDLNSTKN